MTDEQRIGVYVCHCGTNIADTVDVGELSEFAGGLDGVTLVRDCAFLCADSGQRLIQEDIRSEGLTRLVVAACSPLMHESTFQRACQAAGMSPFNLQIANIREQVSWVTPDRTTATTKGKSMVAAAVRRVVLHRELEVTQAPVAPTALVVGGGIAGIETALRLADADKRVVLVERSPSIGGHMAMLDRTFPTLDCSACILVPKMARAADHPNITLLANSEVEEVRGFVGSFKVRVRRRARFVDEERCNGCGTCAERCPCDDIPSEHNQGLGRRTAVYFPFPQAVPHLPLIDTAHCAHFQSDTCRLCEGVCPTEAIDFEQRDEVIDLEVGTVVLATGFQLFDPTRAVEYGYGRWKNILTSLQFERLCHPSGPTGGRIQLEDGRTPESIAILHCVGSRDANYNPHCSRICCMASLKFALSARKRTGAEVFSFYIDMRAAGKDCEEFYEQVQRSGVVFIHGKGTEVIQRGGKLLVKAEDTSLGRRVIVPVDMVVLAVGMEPRVDAIEIGRRFGIACSPRGFFIEKHSKFAPVETATQGLFAAGACLGPKDIPETVAQGAAAASAVLGLVDRGVVDVTPTAAAVDAQCCGGCLLCLHECPYDAIAAESLDDRTVARVNDVLCKSCGSCAAGCPVGAISQPGATQQQIFAEIEGLLGSVATRS